MLAQPLQALNIPGEGIWCWNCTAALQLSSMRSGEEPGGNMLMAFFLKNKRNGLVGCKGKKNRQENESRVHIQNWMHLLLAERCRSARSEGLLQRGAGGQRQNETKLPPSQGALCSTLAHQNNPFAFPHFFA